jgi:hypothetical protein
MRANRTSAGRQRRSRSRNLRLAAELRRVDEQSHKDEMRAALRGDFERLRARRDDPEAPHPGGEVADTTHEPKPVDDGGVVGVPRPPRADDARAPEFPQRVESWLARLLTR